MRGVFSSFNSFLIIQQKSYEISDRTVRGCEDRQIWLVNQTIHQWFLDIWELLAAPSQVFFFVSFFFVTWNLTHWAMIVQWPLRLIKHSSAQAIIHALTCVPLAVAMTTASAWSASYSWSDNWMTTSWISKTRPCGWRNTGRCNNDDRKGTDHFKLTRKVFCSALYSLNQFYKDLSVCRYWKNLLIHI